MSNLDVNAFVSAFVNGTTEKVTLVDSALSLENDTLTNTGTVYGKRLSNNEFIIASSFTGNLAGNLAVEFNDALITAFVKNDLKWSRVKDMRSLFDYQSILTDVQTGNYDKIAMAAKVNSFDIDLTELSIFEKANELKQKIVGVIKERIKVERDAKEAARIAHLAELEAKRPEAERKMLADWDNNVANSSIRSADIERINGGIRVRRRMRGSREVVESTRGEYTTVGQIRQAWDHACQYWYGDKQAYIKNGRYDFYLTGGTGRRCEISTTHLNVGCQSVTKQEAERFAHVMGWPVPTDAATPESVVAA